ncbi:hypothetical protein RM844_24590 [Streptomyces sp. DSM 44915]|uniref:Proline dehydrogenase n=1 Tax=Streptomyces chisholmiae TaxID=3075540 RepID=A0ABU2JWX5_9ACTN|nr:hypothetical protein [Streptomyces sp. DSM 44915]MDT0269465.1 hypothetical protein [Streptomyces sp. DSM 44915]
MVARTEPTKSREQLWAEGRRYLAGTEWPAAVARAESLAAAGLASNIGWLAAAEAADAGTADAQTARYAEVARALGGLPGSSWLEVDTPHVGVDVSVETCVRALRTIADALPAGRMVQVGAEDGGRAEAVLRAVLGAHRLGVPVRATVQANLRRAAADLDRLVAAGVPVRLVKGGFRETAATALQDRAEIDTAFVRLARRVAAAGTPLSLATHDHRMWGRLLPELPGATVELLLGVRSDEALRLAAAGVPVRLYVPFGTAWEGYVAKRVADAEEVARREPPAGPAGADRKTWQAREKEGVRG